MNTKKTIWIVAALLVLFTLVRLPGIDLPYHQDEWKNVSASRNVTDAGLFFAHPPLQQMIFVAAHKVLGDDYMRVFPLLFGLGTALLLFLAVRRRLGEKAAFWSLGLFLICYYNIYASLMPDFDGSGLPFFFLLALYAYDRFNQSSRGIFSRVSEIASTKWRWFTLLVCALLCGFLIKLSFILVIAVFILDYLWINRERFALWKIVKRPTDTANPRIQGLRKLGGFIAVCAGFGALYVLALFLVQGIYPAFNIKFMLGHANQFSEAGAGRNILQVVVQGVKAIYYLSPLVLLLPLWGTREIWRKTRPLWLYLLAGFLFYFVVFDFSGGALDKYLMFAIVPLVAIGGGVLAHIFGHLEKEHRELPGLPVANGEGSSFRTILQNNWAWICVGLIITAVLISFNSVAQIVVPLYPKTAWFSRVLHGEWNVLTPLTGGSGPMGFYISFLFIAASYIVGVLAIVFGWFKKSWRGGLGIILILVGLGYNIVFAQELFSGSYNGNSAAVLNESLGYLDAHPEIKKVITYNDIGAGPLLIRDLYANRFYAAPQFEEGHKVRFADHVAQGGHFLVVGIPPLYDGFYSDFFSKCDTLFETRHKVIIGRVYSCKQLPQ